MINGGQTEASSVTSLNLLTGAISLVGGTNVTITPDGQNIIIDASGALSGLTSAGSIDITTPSLDVKNIDIHFGEVNVTSSSFQLTADETLAHISMDSANVYLPPLATVPTGIMYTMKSTGAVTFHAFPYPGEQIDGVTNNEITLTNSYLNAISFYKSPLSGGWMTASAYNGLRNTLCGFFGIDVDGYADPAFLRPGTVTATTFGYLAGATSNLQMQLNALAAGKSFRGGYDASSNLFPSTGGSGAGGLINAGDQWIVQVQGTLGGITAYVGALIIALVNIPGQTSGNWNISQDLVTSVFGRPGAVIAQTGDYTIAQIANGLSNSLLSGNIFVGNISDVATGITPSGDLSMTNSGIFTLSNSAVIGKILTGFSATNSAIIATDTILQGFNKSQGQINSVLSQLSLLAPLASPVLTGNPTAPTQSSGDNSTRLATTQYVDTGLATKQPSFTVLPISKGGTGLSTSPTAGQVQILSGDSSGNWAIGNLHSPTASIVFTPDGSGGIVTDVNGATVPYLATANTFTANQTIGGGLTLFTDIIAASVASSITFGSPLIANHNVTVASGNTLLTNTLTGISGNIKINPGASGSAVSLAQGLAIGVVNVGSASTSTTFTVRNTSGAFFTAQNGFVFTAVNTLDDGSGNLYGETLTSGTNVTAGSNTNQGIFTSYPPGNGTGIFNFQAVDNSGNFTITLSNAAHAQSTVYSIPDVGAATGQLLNKTAPLVNGNLIQASGAAGKTVDSGVAAASVLSTTGNAYVSTNPDPSPNFVSFFVVADYTALASGGQVVLYTSSGTKQYQIIQMYISTRTNFSGGNRLGLITDGTNSFSIIPAANMLAQANSGWGSVALPFPTFALFTPTASGASLVFKYSGGITDYTAGSILIMGLMQRTH